MPLLFEYSGNDLYCKHEITYSPPCNAFYMHTHRQYELIYFINGDASHVIEDRKYKLKRGDLILIRPSKYHFIEINSSVEYERYSILFDEKLIDIDEVSMVSDNFEVINISSNAIADGIIRKLDFYREGLSDSSFAQILVLLLKELFYNIGIEQSRADVSEADVLSPILSKALQYINENIMTLKSISEVAANLFVTESYLFRLFKKELHQTPKKYVTDKRMILAHKMISLGERPMAVSEKCGFGDYTTFYRAYRQFFGYAPSSHTVELESRPNENMNIK
jgi:AraC-like DNA-binding protein